jgi:hypothetical protein
LLSLSQKSKLLSNKKKRLVSLDSNPTFAPSYDPRQIVKEKEDLLRAKLKQGIQKQCLSEQTQENLTLITKYTLIGERFKSGSDKKNKRIELAESYGIELNNLRIKINRIREKLKDCLQKHLKTL